MEISGRVKNWHKEPLLIGDKKQHPIDFVQEVSIIACIYLVSECRSNVSKVLIVLKFLINNCSERWWYRYTVPTIENRCRCCFSFHSPIMSSGLHAMETWSSGAILLYDGSKFYKPVLPLKEDSFT